MVEVVVDVVVDVGGGGGGGVGGGWVGGVGVGSNIHQHAFEHDANNSSPIVTFMSEVKIEIVLICLCTKYHYDFNRMLLTVLKQRISKINTKQ